MQKNLLPKALANAGKTILFNTLTGYRQKVANYAGVTVSYKTVYFQLPSSKSVKINDLPGIYSLTPVNLNEAVTSDFLENNVQTIDVMLCIVEATQLALHLRLVLQVQHYTKPIIVVLNRFESAVQKGIHIDIHLLEKQLNAAVIVAWIMKKLQRNPVESILLMELPNYRLPYLRDILLDLWEQLSLFF